MKKVTFLVFTLIFSFISQAQVLITDENGDEITQGKVFEYSTLGETTAQLGIRISNNGSSTVYILAEVESMTNASGANLQFCIAELCYVPIKEGTSYGPLNLDPGENNGQFDHFFNNYSGNDTNQPVTYTFRFYEVDENGNELGDLVTFTYLYDSTLNTSNYTMESLGVTLNSSIIVDHISFQANEKVNVDIFDLNGKRVENQSFDQGSNQLNASQLNAGVYLVKFQTLNGKQATTKIIKK